MDTTSQPVAQLPNTYLRQFFRYLGSDRDLLRDTQQTPATLAQLGGHNTFRDYCQFFSNAQSLMNRPDIGLLLEKFTPLRLPVVRTRWSEDPVHIGLEIEFTESALDTHASVTETLLLSISSIVSALSQDAVKLARIDLDYPPPHYAAAYREVFGIPSIQFSRPHIRVLVARSDADFMIAVDHDPRLRALAIERCEQLLEGTGTAPSVGEQVRQVFSDNPGHLWKLEDIARHLNMSDRTLQRRLATEGTRYQVLQNDWLKHACRQLLAEKHLTIESVAMLLGYSEVSNFRQACRRWYGCSPQELRQTL